MNHKWKRAPNTKRHLEIVTSTYICERCELKRDRILTMGEFYTRSGIWFNKQKPDCIDWEKENQKTID